MGIVIDRWNIIEKRTKRGLDKYMPLIMEVWCGRAGDLYLRRGPWLDQQMKRTVDARVRGCSGARWSGPVSLGDSLP